MDHYPRRRIVMAEHVDVVHSVLYYIYTHWVTFSTDVSDQSSQDESLASCCDVEDIYALAHRLEVTGLLEKALSFLKRSCNERNIIKRAFGPLAIMHQGCRSLYELLTDDLVRGI